METRSYQDWDVDTHISNTYSLYTSAINLMETRSIEEAAAALISKHNLTLTSNGEKYTLHNVTLALKNLGE